MHWQWSKVRDHTFMQRFGNGWVCFSIWLQMFQFRCAFYESYRARVHEWVARMALVLISEGEIVSCCTFCETGPELEAPAVVLVGHLIFNIIGLMISSLQVWEWTFSILNFKWLVWNKEETEILAQSDERRWWMVERLVLMKQQEGTFLLSIFTCTLISWLWVSCTACHDYV